MLRIAPAVISILIVVAFYAFIASGGSFDFPRLPDFEASDYASLGEGFLRGHLHMASVPDPRLAALPYPYDPNARAGIWYRWDVSYANGRYYLYFSPLPALLGHIPVRLLRGAWPPDPLIAMLFATWTFLGLIAFARRALAIAGRSLHPLWILFIGLGNAMPFVLVDAKTYEVAILCGAAMTAMWAHALLRWLESPKAARAAWMALWLALAIAARPNLGVLLFVTFAAMIGRRFSIRAAIAGLAPLAIVALALLWYNHARFGKPFEFGHRYQLTSIDMAGRRLCSLCSLPELTRFVNHATHYLFWPPVLRSRFPFVDLLPARLDPSVVWLSSGGVTEQAVGVVPLMPLVAVGTFFALLLVLGPHRRTLDTGTRAALYVLAGAWLILLGLSSCWWVVTRYSLDFMLLIAAATVVCLESGLAFLKDAGMRALPTRIAVVILACWSILAGSFLGFRGQGDAMKRLYPENFQKVARWFE